MQGWRRQSLAECRNVGHIVLSLIDFAVNRGCAGLPGGQCRAFGHISQNLVNVSSRRGKVPHLFVVDVNLKRRCFSDGINERQPGVVAVTPAQRGRQGERLVIRDDGDGGFLIL